MSDELIVSNIITCKRCSLQKPAHKTDKHLCEDCVKAENNRVSHFRRHNFDWTEVAKEAELELWERQPSETDHEYSVWLRYRDAYPGGKPSYRQVAEELGTTINAVRKIGARWNFPTRLQAWAKYVDDITLQQRRQEILDMNKRHVDMAAVLNEKLQRAINNIDPAMLSPREINSLMKTATELERKARLDQPDVSVPSVVPEDDPNLKKTDVKTEDISEIISILGGAGILGNNFGVRQTTTTTTEVVVKEDE